MESVDTPTKLPTVLNGKVVASHSGIGGKEWLGDQTVWLNHAARSVAALHSGTAATP